MTYTAEELEKKFKRVSIIRQGLKEYENDAGYWTGGRCNWGANHNLTEDCQTLTRSFGKMSLLKDVKKELQKSTSQQEFQTTKNRLIRDTENLINGLTPNYGSQSSMFGICIIWSDEDTKGHVESVITNTRREIEQLKTNIAKEEYKYIEELRLLKLEESEIKKKMEENKRKAQKETDPTKRAALILLIEEDGKKLEANLQKQKAIPTSNLKFDPDKYVNDLVEAMKKVAGGGNSGSSGGGNRPPRTPQNPRDPTNPNPDDSDSDSDPDTPNNLPRKPKKEKENNQQLLIFGGIALVVIYFLMNQKENNHDY